MLFCLPSDENLLCVVACCLFGYYECDIVDTHSICYLSVKRSELSWNNKQYAISTIYQYEYESDVAGCVYIGMSSSNSYNYIWCGL